MNMFHGKACGPLREVRRGTGRRLLLRAAAAVAPCLLAASAAFADGMAFKLGDQSRFEPIREKDQVAAIHHRDGVQWKIGNF
ncbi:MAG: hypothetical protein MUC63_02455 [Planctomycetes bacterium]|nr:hypothetical protein [Planctomycetota bacterium]